MPKHPKTFVPKHTDPLRDIRVAIVEDIDEVREALQLIIVSEDGMRCDYVFANGKDALRMMPLNPPDVVLMDINLPDANGIELVKKLREDCPATQFMMCTVYEEGEYIFEALRAGATGYIVKKTPAAQLTAAIRELHHGGSPMSPSIARKVIGAFAHPHTAQKLNAEAEQLSERERELLHMLSQGLRYKEIADKLSISLDTVKRHCQNIYHKLHVQSRQDAVNKAFH
ncbi:MAG: response regulator [Flavobacteriales bacterium]